MTRARRHHQDWLDRAESGCSGSNASRYDRTERTTLALLTLACTVINVRRLIKIELCDQV